MSRRTGLSEMISYTRKQSKYKELHKHLKRLNSLIGMDELKKSVVSQYSL